MASNKGLYILLKENDRIESETNRYMYRSREKAIGFMWDGRTEVTLKTGAKVNFEFWHNCDDDDGSDDWVPSEKQLARMWRPKFVPIGPETNSRRVDASWHTVSVGDHIYVSKLGTFSHGRTKEGIIESIRNGSWEHDSDLWCIV